MMVNNSNTNSNRAGVGFIGALTLLFVALKLTNVIDWSWWWVLSPIWIVALIWLVIVGIAAAVLIAASK